jgi:hypothetical protein
MTNRETRYYFGSEEEVLEEYEPQKDSKNSFKNQQ